MAEFQFQRFRKVNAVEYFFPIQTLIISLSRNDHLDAQIRDADVYVTKVNTNHRAWATCGRNGT